ncbi:MAG TPA: hypothetical protein VN688_13130 [Gemmataceae bacterium]|nr:hypothetical protein [Gemmataceae bacterium]
MNRNLSIHSVKPCLETLEGRCLPSFVLGGAINQLAQPLNAMVADMNSAKADLAVQFNVLHGGTATNAQADEAFGKGSADWQRMLNDQHAITLTSSADVAFINAVALTEFVQGDAIDLIVLRFGGIFGLHPTNALTNPVTQANNINSDTTVQTEVTTDFFGTTPSGFQTHNTFNDEITTPTF